MGLLKARLTGEKRWYADGLRFECTQCGNCCSGAPGYVWVTRQKIDGIAAFLDKDTGWLGKKHLRRVGLRFSLTEKPGGDCIFLIRENGKTRCQIHPVRPVQCQTWPFWSENLRSRANWEAAAKNCPGMNRGKLHPPAVIDKCRRGKPD
ncbi:MAG: YkgJ family cysteine cluster protein [Phycisphaerales bacterium]|nr:MAG: YkgJ family cysteine cluster protein [Phycisphaerales bacterium]